MIRGFGRVHAWAASLAVSIVVPMSSFRSHHRSYFVIVISCRRHRRVTLLCLLFVDIFVVIEKSAFCRCC